MDAISLLKNDHQTVEALFKRFEAAGENAHEEKREILGRLVKELSIHAVVEEQLLYPTIRSSIAELEEEVLEALEEHKIVKRTLAELEKMDPEDERFDAKMKVLIDAVRHHVEEEEALLFPKLQSRMERQELETLGDALYRAKAVAPTHPHPGAPDTPPGNVIAGVLAAAVDRTMDAGKNLVEEVVERSKELIDDARDLPKQATRKLKRMSADAQGARRRLQAKAKRTARKVSREAENTRRRAKAASRRRVAKAKRTATNLRRRTARAVAKTSRNLARTNNRKTSQTRTANKRTRTNTKRQGTRTRRASAPKVSRQQKRTRATQRKSTGTTQRASVSLSVNVKRKKPSAAGKVSRSRNAARRPQARANQKLTKRARQSIKQRARNRK